MTARERNDKIRKKLKHSSRTCGVLLNDEGLAPSPGTQFCVRCGDNLTNARANTHRRFRCQHCHAIICKRPIVRDVAERPVDPFAKLKKEQAAAERTLAQWERRLTMALTKMKEWRATERRIAKRLDVAMAEREAAIAVNVDGKTRRIIITESEAP
jgi:hypothetical protein